MRREHEGDAVLRACADVHGLSSASTRQELRQADDVAIGPAVIGDVVHHPPGQVNAEPADLPLLHGKRGVGGCDLQRVERFAVIGERDAQPIRAQLHVDAHRAAPHSSLPSSPGETVHDRVVQQLVESDGHAPTYRGRYPVRVREFGERPADPGYLAGIGADCHAEAGPHLASGEPLNETNTATIPPARARGEPWARGPHCRGAPRDARSPPGHDISNL